jgi:hypothetical protein
VKTIVPIDMTLTSEHSPSTLCEIFGGEVKQFHHHNHTLSASFTTCETVYPHEEVLIKIGNDEAVVLVTQVEWKMEYHMDGPKQRFRCYGIVTMNPFDELDVLEDELNA